MLCGCALSATMLTLCARPKHRARPTLLSQCSDRALSRRSAAVRSLAGAGETQRRGVEVPLSDPGARAFYLVVVNKSIFYAIYSSKLPGGRNEGSLSLVFAPTSVLNLRMIPDTQGRHFHIFSCMFSSFLDFNFPKYDQECTVLSF